MKKIVALVVTAALVFTGIITSTLAAPGGNPGKGEQRAPRLEGVLQNFNVETDTFDLVTNDPDGKEITISYNYIDKTFFMRNQEKSSEEEFKNGEKVIVMGPVDLEEKTGQALLVCFGPLPDKDSGRPPQIIGLLSELNTDASTFTLTVKDPEGTEFVFAVTYTEKTKFMRDMKPSTPSDFNNGEKVTIMGMIDPEEKTINAMAVFFGKVPQPPQKDPRQNPNQGPKSIPGTIKNINYEKQTFVLLINEEKKLLVEFFDWTKVVLDNELVHWKNLRNDMAVAVVGPIDPTDKALEAHMIQINPGEPGPRANMLKGKLTALNKEKNTFKLTVTIEEETKTINVQYSENTRFFRDGEVASEDDFKNNEEVTVGGRMQEDYLEAFMVAFGELPERGPKN